MAQCPETTSTPTVSSPETTDDNNDDYFPGMHFARVAEHTDMGESACLHSPSLRSPFDLAPSTVTLASSLPEQ